MITYLHTHFPSSLTPWGREVATRAKGLGMTNTSRAEGSPLGAIGNSYPEILGCGTKMVWGHSLQHMPPFGATTGGLCMFFRPVTLVVLDARPHFSSSEGPKALLDPKRGGVRKTCFCGWISRLDN